MADEVKSGYVHKCGKSVKSWKRRWFVLKQNGYLYYYTDSSAKIEKGKIDVIDAADVAPYSDKTRGAEPPPASLSAGNAFVIVTKERVFTCVCETLDERRSWLSALEKIRGVPTSDQKYPAPTYSKSPGQQAPPTAMPPGPPPYTPQPAPYPPQAAPYPQYTPQPAPPRAPIPPAGPGYAGVPQYPSYQPPPPHPPVAQYPPQPAYRPQPMYRYAPPPPAAAYHPQQYPPRYHPPPRPAYYPPQQYRPPQAPPTMRHQQTTTVTVVTMPQPQQRVIIRR